MGLEIAYDFPLTEEQALDYWIDPVAPDTVFTWFRDLDRDLWLPFSLDQQDHFTVGKVFLVTGDGVFRQIEPGGFEGDSNVGEAVIRASALRDVPEGDYWVVLQMTPDEMRGPYHMPWYVLRYVGIYDTCTFHTEDYRVVTGGPWASDCYISGFWLQSLYPFRYPISVLFRACDLTLYKL